MRDGLPLMPKDYAKDGPEILQSCLIEESDWLTFGASGAKKVNYFSAMKKKTE